MRIPLLLLTALLCYVQATQNITADVAAFVAKYRQMNETTDVLRSLERIAEDGRELFRLGLPVGKLVANYNATGKVTEEEKKALDTLHQLFNHSFERNTTELFGKRGHEYDELDSMVRLKCRMPTKKGIQTLSKLQDTLRDVEFRASGKWNVSEFSAVDSYKTELFHFLTIHPDEIHAEQLFKNITELKNIDFNIVMDTLRNSRKTFDDKHEIHPTASICLLETNNQTMQQLKLEYLYRELIQIHLLEWALSSLTEENAKYYFKDGEISALLIERTGHFLADWTRKVQNISWPEIGTEFVKRAIELKNIQNVTNDETARKVQRAFEEHGSPSYSYQVLVVPSSAVDKFWSVGGTTMEDYTNITNFRGLDIHVFRFNKTEVTGRSEKARNWMKKNKEAIKKEIGQGAFLTASGLLANLQTKATVAPLYRDDHYRSMILLKRNKDSPMSFVGSENDSYSLETTRTSYSVINGGKETTATWNAYFFV